MSLRHPKFAASDLGMLKNLCDAADRAARKFTTVLPGFGFDESDIGSFRNAATNAFRSALSQRPESSLLH
jgi:hypothetical protein